MRVPIRYTPHSLPHAAEKKMGEDPAGMKQLRLTAEMR
jgi:hypothetical protein